MADKRQLTKYILLGCLYVSQYIPVSFFYQALPVFLRQQGVALKAIGLLPLASLPWMLKFIWSPIIDRYRFSQKQHYRPWIILCQSLLALTLVVAALLNIRENPIAMIVSLFVVGFFAATQDIATDALAVNLLSTKERGVGNSVQVAGSYLGGIIGGGGMLILLDRLGWRNSLLLMAGFIVLASIPIWLHQEQTKSPLDTDLPSFKTIIQFCRRPRIWTWLVVLVVYTLGTRMASFMFQPLLVDRGFSLADIGLLTGVIGFSGSMLGAPIAGWLITPLGRKKLLIIIGIFQAVAIATYLFPAFKIIDRPVLYLACISVQTSLAMAYTTEYTVMMDKSNPQTAGTDFTLQASFLSFSSIISGGIAGFLADALGYVALFVISSVLTLISVLFIIKTFESKPLIEAETATEFS